LRTTSTADFTTTLNPEHYGQPRRRMPHIFVARSRRRGFASPRSLSPHLSKPDASIIRRLTIHRSLPSSVGDLMQRVVTPHRWTNAKQPPGGSKRPSREPSRGPISRCLRGWQRRSSRAGFVRPLPSASPRPVPQGQQPTRRPLRRRPAKWSAITRRRHYKSSRSSHHIVMSALRELALARTTQARISGAVHLAVQAVRRGEASQGRSLSAKCCVLIEHANLLPRVLDCTLFGVADAV